MNLKDGRRERIERMARGMFVHAMTQPPTNNTIVLSEVTDSDGPRRTSRKIAEACLQGAELFEDAFDEWNDAEKKRDAAQGQGG